MKDNNRHNNIKSIRYASENYGADAIAIYDQCFTDKDISAMPNNTILIGKQSEPKGFIEPRNELLKWFYQSDYDYALMIDAHDKVTAPSLNDLQTVVEAVKNELIVPNVITSSIGIMVSPERILAKQRKDYEKNVWLLRCKKGYEWLHGTIICNFKKRYEIEPTIDTRCNVHEGIVEDVYLIRLLRAITNNNIQVAPTITFSEPNSNESTWVSEEGSYNYPPTRYDIIDKLIKENIDSYAIEAISVPDATPIKRIENESYQNIKRYKPRNRNRG